MARNKYKRKASSSFRRGSPRSWKRPGNAILVVAEGVNTEKIYFDLVRDRFAAPTLEIEVEGAGMNDPTRLVEKALELRAKRQLKAKRGELRHNQLKDFDELWIVFDLDVLKKDKLDEGLSLAKAKGVQVAATHPCFEFWLLLHQEYTSKAFTSCEEVVKHLGWSNYDKNSKDTRNRILPLVEKSLLQKAVTHAKSLEKDHQRSGTPFPECPSSRVHCLIESIHKTLSPANQFLEI